VPELTCDPEPEAADGKEADADKNVQAGPRGHNRVHVGQSNGVYECRSAWWTYNPEWEKQAFALGRLGQYENDNARAIFKPCGKSLEARGGSLGNHAKSGARIQAMALAQAPPGEQAGPLSSCLP